MTKALWWIRRDLRLSDNLTLRTALQHGAVVPVFVLDPHLLERTPALRHSFLFEGLHRLDVDLRERGSLLTIRRGKPAETLAALLEETQADTVFAEEDFTPYARQRDNQVLSRLPLQLVHGQTVHHPTGILKADRKPYTVFTPYSRAWKAALPSNLKPAPAPPDLRTSMQLPSEKLPDFSLHPEFPAGEAEAQQRLERFIREQIYNYQEQRDLLDTHGTSQLSPYIRFGMLSMRQAASASLAAMNEAPDSRAAQSAETWLNELIWREFYIAIMHHFPSVLRESFRQDLRNIRWQNNSSDLEAWQQGLTGYPVVDAGMRQLRQSGWMHNRARMITASFLVKDLLVDWRMGEAWFMQNLLDGDPGANNGGWQWTAGTGTDAAPYFRIFNPVLQSQKFDPQGKYIRRWLPELAQVPGKFIHTPWKMPLGIQNQAGCRIGRDYPPPVIEHAMARRRVLDLYNRESRKGS
jgi:deoxyribodipyrimidine photo-lyase